ncbi:MAG: NFACT RNA binding domain-containing protein [Erysipelotrichales bacterium]
MIDGLLTNKICTNLKEKLISGRIQKIYQINNTEILFKVRANRTNYQLINSIDNNSFRLHITQNKYDTLDTATNLTMNFRKHLEGGIIKDIYQNECDRTITFEIIKFNEMRDEQVKYLIFELTGRHANTMLADSDYTIIDALKFLPISSNLKRMIQRNLKFEYASVNDKLNPLNGIENTENYQQVYQGFSKELNNEFIYLNKQDISAQESLDNYLSSTTIYAYKKCLSYIPLSHLEEEPRIFDDLDEAFDYKYMKESSENSLKSIYKAEIKHLKGIQKRNKKKIAKLQQQYQDNLNYDIYKIKGTLIYDNLYQFDKNQHYDKITVFDYEKNEEVILYLDDKISLVDNATKEMKLYNKAKKSFAYLEEQIELAKKQNNEIEEALSSINYSSVNDFSEVIDYFKENYNIKHVVQNKKKKKKKKEVSYESLVNDEGVTILIGKNSIQNNHVTFKLARKNDIWLHIKDESGSHVIIKDDNPSDSTLEQAARLALFYSNAKPNVKYEVMYTPIVNVTKLKGHGIGMVSLKSYQSIFIENDHEMIKEIRDNVSSN